MIKSFFIYNWKIKLVCLLLAVGFWVYVSAIGVRIDDFPGGVPLELRNVPEGLVAITDTQNIDVSIVSEKNIWSKVSEDSINAFVNCSNLNEGTYELSVIVETKVAGIQINEYSPQKVLVRIEPKSSKEIDVKTKIEGSASDGMIASIPLISPEKVTIYGPKSIIDRIFQATAIIRLDGESDEIIKKAKLVALDFEGNIINSVSFSPSEVEVKVPIIKIDTTKNVGIKVNTIGSLASGFWLSSVYSDPAQIAIAGESEKIQNIYYIQTKPVDIKDLSSNFSKNVELDIPPGVTVLDNINNVLVFFELSENLSSKELPVKINFKNLPSYLSISNIDPSSVKVIISAQDEVLKNINAQSIVCEIDLNSMISEGEYYIQLQQEMFKIPDNVSLLNFLPSSVKVILQRK